MGYDVERMNERYALVLVGSKAVVMEENPTAPIEERHALRTLEAFGTWHSNKFTQVWDPNLERMKVKTWAAKWMTDSRRRQYSGLAFFPNPDGASPPHGYYNLWRGYSVTPRRGGRWSVLRDHLLTNICEGDEQLFKWVFGWFAHIFQRPRERIGTALVLRGKMGAGKTKPGEIFGSLIASHYFLVDDPRYVTGQFNAHMASCLLLQAEEAVWAGDKAAEGRLKGLVTSKFQMIENKGVDPIRLDNYVRLIMTSNEGWVVPAGLDERRFCVLDVGDRVLQNHEYFGEMDAELDAGGREALLADLLEFDLSQVNLRVIPKTSALLEQKIRSLSSVQSWWFERLRAGTSRRKSDVWESEPYCTALFDDYLAEADSIGIKRRSEATVFGIELHRLVPRLERVRISESGGTRPWVYRMPGLEECREAFGKAVGQTINWDKDLSDEASDPGPWTDER